MIQSQEHEWFPVVSTSSFFCSCLFFSHFTLQLKFSTLPVNYSLEIKVAFDLCLSLTVNNYYMYPMNLKIKLITAFKLIIVLLMVTTLQVNCDTCTKLYVYWTSMYFMIKMVELYKSISLIYHLVIVYFFLLFIISTLDL